MHIHSSGFGSGGGGGRSQAGFHTVNYSVANSAPGRGGRRESESEASHSGAAKAGRTRLNWGHRAAEPIDLKTYRAGPEPLTTFRFPRAAGTESSPSPCHQCQKSDSKFLLQQEQVAAH